MKSYISYTLVKYGAQNGDTISEIIQTVRSKGHGYRYQDMLRDIRFNRPRHAAS